VRSPTIPPDGPERHVDHTYKISEIVGSSAEGVDDAIKNGIGRASKTLRNLDWFEVTDIRGAMNDGAIAWYQVTMKVGFRLDDGE
jgi:flavin-binding protein dodecin